MDILLVDDDPEIREVLQSQICERGHRCTQAENGKSGMVKFINGNFDLIITDLKMDNVNGTQLIEGIRETNDNTPIVLLTAYPTEELNYDTHLYENVSLLFKPYSLEELHSLLRRVEEKQVLALDNGRGAKSERI